MLAHRQETNPLYHLLGHRHYFCFSDAKHSHCQPARKCLATLERPSMTAFRYCAWPGSEVHKSLGTMGQRRCVRGSIMDDLHDHRAEEVRWRGRGETLSSQSWTTAGHPKDSSYNDVGGSGVTGRSLENVLGGGLGGKSSHAPENTSPMADIF